MFPYLAIFIFVSFIFFSESRKINLSIIFFLISFVFIAGFRDMIGGFDVYIYAEVYEKLIGTRLFIYQHFEKGYLAYYYLLQKIHTSREFMFFITSLIITGLHISTIRKLSPNIGISLFIYFCKFFLFSFVYLRQGLAMGIVWMGLLYIINKKYLGIIALSAIAFTFHRSSIIFLPFIILAHLKFKTHQWGVIAFIILLISLTPLSNILFSSLAEIDNTGKIAAYSEYSSGVNFFYLMEGGIGVYLSIIFQKYFYQIRKTKVIINGFFMYSVIILAGLTNATFIRFSWYYFIFIVLALPYIYYFFEKKNYQMKPIFKNLVFVYYSLVFFRLLIVYDGGDFMPYKTIFSDCERNGRWEFMEYRK